LEHTTKSFGSISGLSRDVEERAEVAPYWWTSQQEQSLIAGTIRVVMRQFYFSTPLYRE
jgi:hypothetical protein